MLLKHQTISIFLTGFSLFSATPTILFMKSVGTKSPIRLRFTLPEDNSKEGSIKYENGIEPILIRRVRGTVIEKVPGGRPWVIESEWDEILDGKFSGKYFFRYQGAIVISFRYVKKNGAIIKFEEDHHGF